MFLDLTKHRLDVDHGCAIDGFDGTDSQAILDELANRDLMKADWIRPVWGSGREDTGKRTARI